MTRSREIRCPGSSPHRNQQRTQPAVAHHSPILGLPRLFNPAQATEILRGLGLPEITECALRTRAYRRQVPFHLNGHRIRFTASDLREIAEGQARQANPAHLPEAPRSANGRAIRRSSPHEQAPAADLTRSRPAQHAVIQQRAEEIKPRRPKPWSETSRQGRTRYVWRFEGQRYWTHFHDDPEEARADAATQITEQLEGSWHKRTGCKMFMEDWIGVWMSLLGDIEPTTRAKYKYLAEGHILPAFQRRELGSLTFEEIEAWDNAISTQISARGRPFARSVATSARSLLITILSDAVHAGRIDRNPAERRKGLRGRKRVKGRGPSRAARQSTPNVITPFQALCLAERCALLSGRNIDLVMNVFAAWTGVRWGELIAVEGWSGNDSPLQLPKTGVASYAVDWQLREIGGAVSKSAPKDGSFRVLDLPPFLADLMYWAISNRQEACSCPVIDNMPACKGEDQTPASYLFLGSRGGHPRRSNYAADFLTPAAEGLHPARQGLRRPLYVTAEPWPGIPIRRGNRRDKSADLADGTWPNLTGKFRPHDYRHSHATWLDATNLGKVIQMDRRGHVLQGMDRIYTHVTHQMRERLCELLEELWQDALAERYKIDNHSHVPLLNQLMQQHRISS